MNLDLNVTLAMVFLPLIGAIFAGLCGKKVGKKWTHRVLVTLVGISFFLSLYLLQVFVVNGAEALDATLYTWANAGLLQFDVAFLIDRLSVLMSAVVLFVSFMVHIYTIAYMDDDPGYTRFFSYVSLFTFAMLMLVLADNFLVMFFGWEGVGLVSYLLIGFWFKKDSANVGSLKAFLVNRVGDIGFILAIACVLMYFGTFNFLDVFREVPAVVDKTMPFLPNISLSVISVICVFLFFSAMAKSAQVPLHVWLPESMEGPTPISALIHAATMVTAGIYMVCRCSPLFEYSTISLTIMLILGGTTAFFLGIVAVVQFDIKRVIAYSTISQLGYMVVALGASAYDGAMFHLMMHAFFKALLFLAAGSVIIAMHHEQDMRKMGGLARYLPVTYLTFLVGAFALCAIPPFSGFYSKDMIIEAARVSTVPGAYYAYLCVLAGAFITPLYTFRAVFMTFHGKERVDSHLRGKIEESNWTMWVPLVLLAIPSFFAGQALIEPMLFAHPTLFGNTIFVLPDHDVLAVLGQHFHGAVEMALEAGSTLAFWFALAGIVTAWYFTLLAPQAATAFTHRFKWLYKILIDKYGFDAFNQMVFVRGTRDTGELFYKVGDETLLDHVVVNGSGRFIGWLAKTSRLLQTGYLYHYALAMILGLVLFLAWYVL